MEVELATRPSTHTPHDIWFDALGFALGNGDRTGPTVDRLGEAQGVLPLAGLLAPLPPMPRPLAAPLDVGANWGDVARGCAARMYRHRRLSSSSMTASRGDSFGAEMEGTRVLDPAPENSALGMTPVGYMDLHWMGVVTYKQRDEGPEK